MQTPLLGRIPLDPDTRQGGDTGIPAALIPRPRSAEPSPTSLAPSSPAGPPPREHAEAARRIRGAPAVGAGAIAAHG